MGDVFSQLDEEVRLVLERAIQYQVDRRIIDIVSEATDMRGSPHPSVQDVVEPIHNAVMTAISARLK